MPSFNCPNCGVTVSGTNCAMQLSYECGVTTTENSHTWGCCGLPIRAKQVREFYYGGFIDNDKTSTEDAFIYCEKNGRGHVYYGTYAS